MANVKKSVPETEEQRRNRELVESIANNIASLAGAVESLLRGPLKRQALVILLASSSRMSQQAVAQVLTALQDLRKDWLNK